MVTLNKKDTKLFLKKVEEGLKHPTAPVPTPKLDGILKKIKEDYSNKLTDKLVNKLIKNLTITSNFLKEHVTLENYRYSFEKAEIIDMIIEALKKSLKEAEEENREDDNIIVRSTSTSTKQERDYMACKS